MDFPMDLVALILVCLPVKSLLRFRCVCKAWCALIGSRHFIYMHLQHPYQGDYLVLKHSDGEEDPTTIGELFSSFPQAAVLSFYCRDGGGGDVLKTAAPEWRIALDVVEIGGSINGICLVAAQERKMCRWFPRGWGYDTEYPLYLCNPATRELRRIPHSPFGRERARPYSHNLCIPYYSKRVGMGFGYDPYTNNYKVVSIMHFIEDHYYSDASPYGPLAIEIYDLNSNSWRVSETGFPTIEIYPSPGDPVLNPSPYPMNRDLNRDTSEQGMFGWFVCGVFFNGSIHWNAGQRRIILAFNITDEVMRAFHLPRAISWFESDWPRILLVLHDSLAFVQWVMSGYDHRQSTSFYIWVMVEYGDEESWIKRYYFQPGVYMDILTFWNDTLIFETEDGELVSCNLQENDASRQFRKDHHITRYNKWDMMRAMAMHKESLVPLSR